VGDINLAELQKYAGAAQAGLGGAGGVTPGWLKTAESVTNNLREILKEYDGIRNAKKPEVYTPSKPAYIPQQGAVKQIPVIENNRDFQELLSGLTEALSKLESMGFGDKGIGEAINALPFTVRQCNLFLTKLYRERFVK